MTITDKTIQSYIRQAQKEPDTKYKFFSIGNNLWLRVHSKTGNASWLYRIAMPDASKKSGYKFSYITIGSYPEISLLKARLNAAELKAQVKSGVDPVENREKEAKRLTTLEQVFWLWVERAQIKDAYLRRLKYDFNRHLKQIGDIPMVKLTPQIVMQSVIEPILDNGNPAQAKIILNKIKQLADFAYRTFITDTNQLERLSNDFYTVKPRNRVLNNQELRVFLQAMDSLNLDIVSYAYIKLTLLLGTRKMELATLRWVNCDINARTIKLVDTKNGIDLLIKLPDQAVALLNKLPVINEYVFPSAKKDNSHISQIYPNRHLKLIATHANIKNLTVHDLRRTFVTKLAEMGYPHELIDKAVNHKLTGIRAHYFTSAELERRGEMLQAWANYLDEVIK
jgi:integrase